MRYGPFLTTVNFSDKNEVRRLFCNRSGRLDVASARLLAILSAAGCRTVVEESEYIDSDFRDSYNRFYYLQHRDTPRRCQRLHFFSTIVTPRDLGIIPAKAAFSYLGFAVVRPLPDHRFGRTLLATSVAQSMFGNCYPGEELFLTCAASHTVNLAGNQLGLHGTPWMQQDKLVATCASVSIWTANWHMSNRFPRDFRKFTIARITDLAVQFNMSTGRAMPSAGLTIEQIILALQSLAGCGKTRFEADGVPRNSLVSTAQPDKKKACVEKS